MNRNKVIITAIIGVIVVGYIVGRSSENDVASTTPPQEKEATSTEKTTVPADPLSKVPPNL
ncbi:MULTISPECIES: hypothetical protein [Paenibacillus]|uniref:hypothetical protein n=1 Tax=Paenibacillus TaxID=44249 RepID=UPI00117F5D3E|nr:hypothetical protein [Paenibacillus rhizosphaerae]